MLGAKYYKVRTAALSSTISNFHITRSAYRRLHMQGALGLWPCLLKKQ
jgi:hypothetical protein